MIRLNQQLVEASLKLAEGQKTENQLKHEVEEITKRLSETRQEMAKLSSEKVILNMEHENTEAGLKADLKELRAKVERLKECEKEQSLKNSKIESDLKSQVETLKNQVS